jgi:cobalt/nickel transport system ATP-binding protein
MQASAKPGALAHPEIEVDRVRFAYSGNPVLDGVSLRVGKGDRIALLGANGSGKSTLLRLIDGLIFPSSGVIRFRGQQVDERSLARDEFNFAFRRAVGFVFQNPDVQLFHSTVYEEVAFGPLQLGLPQDEIDERVHAALDRVGAAHLKARGPHRLSGGEKKKVAIAATIVLNPSILLLDEPTAWLDPRSQYQIIELIASLHAAGATLLISTHDLNMVARLADRCLVLDSGVTVASGDVRSVLGDRELLESANLVYPGDAQSCWAHSDNIAVHAQAV